MTTPADHTVGEVTRKAKQVDPHGPTAPGAHRPAKTTSPMVGPSSGALIDASPKLRHPIALNGFIVMIYPISPVLRACRPEPAPSGGFASTTKRRLSTGARFHPWLRRTIVPVPMTFQYAFQRTPVSRCPRFS